MQANDPKQQQMNQQQVDIHSYPLPIRIKHPSWAIRKGTYEQILYYIKSITTLNEQILISGTAYTIDTLLPHFQTLVQEKHASVLLKGLQCVQHILKLDKKLSNKHCIKTLIDKGIEYFPLMSQQRKGILEKFLDVLELSRVDAVFLKNKLNLTHEKSVMYVIEVIGVLNVTQLKGVLITLSKKHQKKCVRELAAEIAQQLQPPYTQPSTTNQQQQPSLSHKPPSKPSIISKSATTSKSNLLPSTCKLTIQKLPHYQQLPSKKQQQYSNQLVQKIPTIIQQYTLSQVPSFSHVLRLMVDDNNHIINVNAIKVMIQIFQSQGGSNNNSSSNKSLIPQSFPLLFIFNKFKSHKTHPINSLLLSLAQAILKSTTNRVNDLLLAINEGLTCTGSKANVKFGCSLTFFRILSLIYANNDLYMCTTNENIQNENYDLEQKFTSYNRIKLTKNQLKLVQKIINILQKDKKYDTEMYLIKYAIGQLINCGVDNNRGFNDQLMLRKQKKSSQPSIQHINNNKSITSTTKLIKPPKVTQNSPIPSQSSSSSTITKTLTQSKSTLTNKFTQINLQSTLNQIIKSLNNNSKSSSTSLKSLKTLLQKSTQQFYTCVRQRKYEMFYLCELLQSFIQNYIVKQQTIQHVSQYLTNLLRIISLLKPLIQIQQSTKYKQLAITNVSQLLLVSLCKLAIGEQIHYVLQNINANYGYEIVLHSLEALFINTNEKNQQTQNKIKKKNKKHLTQWLQSNTPSMFVNSDYYKLIQTINQSKKQKKEKIIDNKTNNNTQSHIIIGNQTPTTTTTTTTIPNTPKQQPKLKQTPPRNYNNNNKKSTIPSPHQQYQPLQSSRKKHLDIQLQDMNLSKIENNHIEQSNYYDDEDEIIEKSSFHQNIEEQLKQISMERSYGRQRGNGYGDDNQLQQQQQRKDANMSREYLRGLDVDKFKKKVMAKNNQDEDIQANHNAVQTKFIQSPFNDNNKPSQTGQSIAHNNDFTQQQYMSKFNQVEQRRLQRQKQRRQFMDRMKCEYKPVMPAYMENNQEEDISGQVNENSEGDGGRSGCGEDGESLQQSKQEDGSDNHLHSQQHQQQQLPFLILNQSPSFSPQQQQSQSPPNNKPTTINDSSFLSTNSTGEFKYKFINHQKLSYMLKSTTNPYPHLRTLILIPFKSSPKKHSFLQQLFHFYTHHVEFKSPQPYTGLVLLTILMFSQIKQDKTLIQPLQSLYELVAKQSTTNQFLKTIITLFHTVIQQTLLANRKFLITILLKSMLRMLPFIEDGLSLLRDIQQFYQIGQMVYFEMFEDEYRQIKECLQEQGVHVIVEKALEEEGENLRAIAQGWLATGWKAKVIQSIQELSQYQEQQQYHDQNNHQHHDDEQYNNDHQQQHYESHNNYKSYI